MNLAVSSPRPIARRSSLLVPAMWSAGLLAVALAGAPGRSFDALCDRFETLVDRLAPAGVEPAMLTGMLLFGIPLMMLAAILLSVAAYRD